MKKTEKLAKDIALKDEKLQQTQNNEISRLTDDMTSFHFVGLKKENLLIGLALSVNFITGVAIVMSNKLLYMDYKVPPLFLTSFQFFCTFGGLLLFKFFGLFEIKVAPIFTVIPLSIAFCVFVIFSNLSLKFNTVGTYQILKCLADPCTFLLQVTIYGKVFSGKIKLALSWIVIGIMINYSTDVKLNLVGTLCGLTAVLATSLYYTWVGTKQEELFLSPPQLLFYQSSLSSVFLLLLVILFELPTLQESNITAVHTMGAMLASGLIALLLNTSVFYIINRTSVITYAVFCKLKICVVITAAYFLFDERMTYGQVIGVLITLSGTMFYTFLQNKKTIKVPKISRSKADESIPEI